MTLRLTDSESDLLRRQAELENRSQQDVARAAVREYIHRHSEIREIAAILDIITPRYRTLLDRLGE